MWCTPQFRGRSPSYRTLGERRYNLKTQAEREAKSCAHLVNAIDVCPSKRQFLRRRPQVEEHRVVQGTQTCLQAFSVVRRAGEIE